MHSISFFALFALANARDPRYDYHPAGNTTSTSYPGYRNATAVYPRTSGHGTVYPDGMSYNTRYPDYYSYYNATTTTTPRRHAFDSNTTAEPTGVVATRSFTFPDPRRYYFGTIPYFMGGGIGFIHERVSRTTAEPTVTA